MLKYLSNNYHKLSEGGNLSVDPPTIILCDSHLGGHMPLFGRCSAGPSFPGFVVPLASSLVTLGHPDLGRTPQGHGQ